MSGVLTFNGGTSEMYHLRLGGVNVYDAPGRSVQTYVVPGRIGAVYPSKDLSILPNQIREYTAALYLRAASMETVERAFAEIREWLMTDGYRELMDTYEPQFYRRAFFEGDFSPVRRGAGQNFEIPLRFSCDPRRFILGASDLRITAAGSSVTYLTPEMVNGFSIDYTAKPLIYISKTVGVVTVTFSRVTSGGGLEEMGKITIDGAEDDFFFDAETLVAYHNDLTQSSANNMITDVTGEIQLGPGATNIAVSASALAMTITPRWYVR